MNGNFAYDDPTLVAVIGATDTAIEAMHNVNKNVLGISGQMPVVNNSASGQKLSARLGDWYYEFGQVIAALVALNDKAKGILATNRSVNTDTAQAT